MEILNEKDFYNVGAVSLAQNLIGKWIATNFDGKEIKSQITETEAYLGIDDSACHSFNGKRTARTETMWKEAGTIYIYLCYGMHYMINIVSSDLHPEAVLIRATSDANGPGKTTKFLNIDKSLNNKSIINNSEICIKDDKKLYSYKKATRVGIDYAKEKDKTALLRFILES